MFNVNRRRFLRNLTSNFEIKAKLSKELSIYGPASEVKCKAIFSYFFFVVFIVYELDKNSSTSGMRTRSLLS